MTVMPLLSLIYQVDLNSPVEGAVNHIDVGLVPLPVCEILYPTLTIARLRISFISPLTENITTDGSFPLSESNIAGFLSATLRVYFIPSVPKLRNHYCLESICAYRQMEVQMALLPCKRCISPSISSCWLYLGIRLWCRNNSTANMIALQMAVWNAFYDQIIWTIPNVNRSWWLAFANASLCATQSIAAPNAGVSLTILSGQDLVLQNCITTEPSTCNATNNLLVTGFVSLQMPQPLEA